MDPNVVNDSPNGMSLALNSEKTINILGAFLEIND
jgi:hypothetical protein